MSSSVLELKQDALNPKVCVTDLLRKALVLSSELGQKEFENWIENELRGYSRSEDTPDYRQVFGRIKYFNPCHGWRPIAFKDEKMGETFRKRKVGQTVAELDNILAGDLENNVIKFPLPDFIQNELRAGTGLNEEMTFIAPETQIIKILDAVRNIVLEWALKLEEQGILGENLSFSKEDKEAASNITQNITNIYGEVHNSQFQLGNETATQIANNQTIDLEALRALISEISQKTAEFDLDEEKEAELNAEINTVNAQLDSPKPKKGIISEGLDSIKKILEGAGGGVAAHLLVELGKAVAG